MSRAGPISHVTNTAWQQALKVCPPRVQQLISQLPASVLERVEEIRFRIGQPLQMCGNGFDRYLHQESGLTDQIQDAWIVDFEQLDRVVQGVTQSSLYAVEDDLRRGFVTVPGGHRAGLAGRAVLFENGQVRSIRTITSVNLRIAREFLGAADGLKGYVVDHATGRLHNVLVISPPQCGKTTLLRDLVRQWSLGTIGTGVGKKVCVVDERSEIAGSVDGVAQFQLGPRTDILDACPKADGMLMAIRSLSPDLIVTDEIGRKPDRDAILEAAHAGVAVLASAHAASLEEWKRRPYMHDLFDARAFHRYVILSRRQGPGTIEQVLDGHGNPLRGMRRPGELSL